VDIRSHHNVKTNPENTTKNERNTKRGSTRGREMRVDPRMECHVSVIGESALTQEAWSRDGQREPGPGLD